MFIETSNRRTVPQIELAVRGSCKDAQVVTWLHYADVIPALLNLVYSTGHIATLVYTFINVTFHKFY